MNCGCVFSVLFVLQPDAPVQYPILADPHRKITGELNMLDPDEKGPNGKPLASRALHIIGPDKRVSSKSLKRYTTIIIHLFVFSL
jgi:1-Cys peroxiredoxin 6